jgi:hypothetical protein
MALLVLDSVLSSSEAHNRIAKAKDELQGLWLTIQK